MGDAGSDLLHRGYGVSPRRDQHASNWIYISNAIVESSMKPETLLVRDPGDRSLSRSVFVRQEPVRGGQRARYRVRLRSSRDVDEARRAKLALSLLEPKTIANLGYPLSFKPRLLVGEHEAAAIDETRFKPIIFHSESAARDPTLEDTIVAMLMIDPLGARRIAVRNRNSLDGVRLLKRILGEDKERLAYRVRLDEFAPGLPAVPGVRPIPRAGLQAEDRREFAQRP